MPTDTKTDFNDSETGIPLDLITKKVRLERDMHSVVTLLVKHLLREYKHQ